eukprot:TRINITY_DN6840_c0_g2_i2.p1 TRINITY_DN6840_c0_g2~~TRINITY_DN6840_c0_g2_i2.p1  ORF type:complete len:308 (-),score=131.06 TRINITY_DN6840_c0_g2_i2:188-1111(-)
MGKRRWNPPPAAPRKERMDMTAAEYVAEMKEQSKGTMKGSKALADFEDKFADPDDNTGPVKSVGEQGPAAGPAAPKEKKKKKEKKREAASESPVRRRRPAKEDEKAGGGQETEPTPPRPKLTIKTRQERIAEKELRFQQEKVRLQGRDEARRKTDKAAREGEGDEVEMAPAKKKDKKKKAEKASEAAASAARGGSPASVGRAEEGDVLAVDDSDAEQEEDKSKKRKRVKRRRTEAESGEEVERTRNAALEQFRAMGIVAGGSSKGPASPKSEDETLAEKRAAALRAFAIRSGHIPRRPPIPQPTVLG